MSTTSPTEIEDRITPPEEPLPSGQFMAMISHEYARRHLVLSNGTVDNVEQLLVCDRTSTLASFNVGVVLKRPIRERITSAERLATAIDRAYTRAATDRDNEAEHVVVRGSEDVATDLDRAVQEAERDLLNTQGKAPAVRLVDLILFEALQQGASDIHVQPVCDCTLVRYRVDGSLHTVRELPGSLAASVVSRIKVMSNLDLAERRAPQDGRAKVSIGLDEQSGRSIDLRVSTLPSTYGERVVVRLLDPSRSPHLSSFSALGMPAEIEREYLSHASRTSGIVLSTGPTGSGKTTTLYATLAWISSTNAGGSARGCDLNMMTVEDPVEYDLSGRGLSVSQTQVDPHKNVTFATGLRHILRQDPDVIMVGEIRDEETARIAVQASLTGHLVLSTLHTNDSASAIARLLDLGVEPFLVSSSVGAILAQRLVRMVHDECSGKGCPNCLDTGFRGRVGVFELLVIDARIRELIEARASAVELKDAARQAGCVSLVASGRSLVSRGLTTEAEITRAIDAHEEIDL